mgnify:CR=1 FL=1
MYVHIRDQNDNTTYASTRWVPSVRHFLACKDVAGGSQQSGGRTVFLPGHTSLRAKVWLVGPSSQGGKSFFFARTHFLACEDVAGGSQQSGGESFFFARTHFLACEGIAGGSQQSGGESFFSGRTSLRAKM